MLYGVWTPYFLPSLTISPLKCSTSVVLRCITTSCQVDGYVRRSYADPFRGGGGSTAARGQRFRVGTFKLVDPVVVREQPDMSSRKLATLKAGVEVHVVDKDPSGLWYKIESETGNRPPGWIPTQAAKRLDAAR